MTVLHYTARAFLGFSSLFVFTTAQATNTTGSNNQTCSWDSASINYNTPVNATGRVSFRWQNAPNNEKDWYLSTVLNDSSIRLKDQPWISVPDASRDEICVYRFAAQNATTSNTRGHNGCEGILTQPCINALRNISIPLRPSGGVNTRLSCRDRIDYNAVEAACTKSITKHGLIFTTNSLRFNNRTCSVASPPGGTVPEGYTTFEISIGSVIEYPYVDNITMYDLYARQTVPWVIAASFERGIPESAVVCVAPNNIKQGSRVPQGQWPPEGSVNTPISTSSACRASQYIGLSTILITKIAIIISIL